jgi:hypothetical protein
MFCRGFGRRRTGYLLDRQQLEGRGKDPAVSLSARLQKVLSWLHAGYPTGIPQQDYYPLLAFLARSLKPDEVSEVASALEAEEKSGHQTTSEDVRAAIEVVTKSPALAADVQRVEERMRDQGWTLEPVADR